MPLALSTLACPCLRPSPHRSSSPGRLLVHLCRQYEAAARLMHDLTFSWLQLALVGIGLMQMWVWHVTLYPATFE